MKADDFCFLENLPAVLSRLPGGTSGQEILNHAQSVFDFIHSSDFVSAASVTIEESKPAPFESLWEEIPFLVPGFRHIVMMPDRIGGGAGLIASRLGVWLFLYRWHVLKASGARAWVSECVESYPVAFHPGPLVEFAAFAALFPEALTYDPNAEGDFGTYAYQWWRDPRSFEPRLEKLGLTKWKPTMEEAERYYRKAYRALVR